MSALPDCFFTHRLHALIKDNQRKRENTINEIIAPYTLAVIR